MAKVSFLSTKPSYYRFHPGYMYHWMLTEDGEAMEEETPGVSLHKGEIKCKNQDGVIIEFDAVIHKHYGGGTATHPNGTVIAKLIRYEEDG